MERIIRTRNLVAYGIGDLYGGGSFLIISTLLLFFLTEVAGLSPVQAGLVVGVGKIWDAVSDPLMGYVSDHVRTRFGRRRVFFLLGIAPIAVSFALLWVPVRLGDPYRFIWYLVTYMLFCTVFTMVMVPYSALNADMSTDYQVRNRLSGTRMLFSQISALIAGVVPKLILGLVPGDQGYLVMGISFGLLYAIPWIFVYLGTWELPHEPVRSKERVADVYRRFLSVLQNRSFRIHIGMYIAAYAAMDVMMALFIYYTTYYLGRDAYYSAFLGTLVLTQLACLPFYVKLNNAVGYGRAFMLGLSLWTAGLLLLLTLTPQTSLGLIFPVIMLMGTGMSAGVMIPWAMLPAVTDVDELITGQRRAGLYAGMMTLLRQAVQALTLFLVGIGLSGIGFIPGQSQSAATLSAFRLSFTFAPLLLLLLGLAVASRFRITPAAHKVMMAEISRVRSGGAREDADSAVAQVCETLTGIKYGHIAGAAKVR